MLDYWTNNLWYFSIGNNYTVHVVQQQWEASREFETMNVFNITITVILMLLYKDNIVFEVIFIDWLMASVITILVLSYITNWHQFSMFLSCYWSWILSLNCQSIWGSADSFDNVMTKFIVNNRTDTWKTGVNSLFTIINCQVICSSLLSQLSINYKFMCLCAYWQWKLANKHMKIPLVIVKNKYNWPSSFVGNSHGKIFHENE